MDIRRAVVLLLLATLGSSPAFGYRIYNKMSQKAEFAGEKCAHCYRGTIEPGDSKACPGDDEGCRGTTYISVETDRVCNTPPNGSAQWFVYMYSPIEVDAHGWIEVYDGYKCIVYDANGTPKALTQNGVTIGGTDANGNPIRVDMLDTCGSAKD